MALFHLNMNELFLIDLFWRLRTAHFCDWTYWVALQEVRVLGLLEHPRGTPRLEHVLDLHDALAEFEGQVPLVVMVQGAVVFAKISGLAFQINFVLGLFYHTELIIIAILINSYKFEFRHGKA